VLGKMIAAGAKVNGADPGGQTALMWAAAKGKPDNIAFLIKHGANVNAVTRNGFTPLFFALRSKVPQAASLLLDAGADQKAVLPDGTSVAGAAVLENNVPFAVAVVEKGADLNQRDKEGRQLIHVAAASGSLELVKLVLSKGGDANAMTQPPPTTMPAAGGGARVKGGLAAADGSSGPPKPPIVSMPPLLFAARAGSLDAMKALVEAGAKPDTKADDGTTLALAAAYGGNLAALKYALELDPDLTAITKNGRSIMHMAVMNTKAPEQQAVIQFLADKGATLDVKDQFHQTPGDFLNRGQSPETLRVFYIDLLKQHGIVGTAH
jgi:ankyrin repeat protein